MQISPKGITQSLLMCSQSIDLIIVELKKKDPINLNMVMDLHGIGTTLDALRFILEEIVPDPVDTIK